MAMIEKVENGISCETYPACDCASASECVEHVNGIGEKQVAEQVAEQVAGTASDADAARTLSEFVTIEQCAESLSIRPNTLRLWIRRDGFPVIKVGGNTKRAKAFVHVPTMREWMLKRQTFGSRFAGERKGSRLSREEPKGFIDMPVQDHGPGSWGPDWGMPTVEGYASAGYTRVPVDLDRMLEDFRTSIEDLRQKIEAGIEAEIAIAAKIADAEAASEAESEAA